MRITPLVILASLTLTGVANAQSLIDCKAEGTRVHIYKVNPSATNLACSFQCLFFDARGVLKQSITSSRTVIASYSSSVSVNVPDAPDGIGFRTSSAKCQPTSDAASTESEVQSAIEVK